MNDNAIELMPACETSLGRSCKCERLLHAVCMLPLCGLVTVSMVLAQSVPSLTQVNVTASVSSAGSDVLRYSYKIANPISNEGSIWLVNLDIQKQAGSGYVSGDGLQNDDAFFVNTSNNVLKRIGDEVLPVGVQTPPSWDSTLTLSRTIQWSAPDDAPLIRAGSSLDGFRTTSHGLPGIRTLTVEAYADPDALPVAPPDGPADLPRYDAAVAALKQRFTATATTIGPIAPPASFQPADFLNTIINTKEQAIRRGWIKDQGIGVSLDAKLNAASASLARGNTKTAVNQLNALLNEVDAQAGKQLTSEAVALLKFNTQYLISKIR
jgi:hypothetical protein